MSATHSEWDGIHLARPTVANCQSLIGRIVKTA
jgi:hypothetical protein